MTMSRNSGRTAVGALITYAAFMLGVPFGRVLAGGKDSSPAIAHVQVPTDSASIAAGGKLFRTYCVPCHGKSGRGDGPTGAALKPKRYEANIEVDECPAPNGSYSLSERLVNPESPPPCRNVVIRSRRPVRILCGYA